MSPSPPLATPFLSALAALCALAWPGMARAAVEAAVPVAAMAAGTDTPVTLFVELVVNGDAKGAIVEVVQQGSHMLIDADTLRRAGIATVRDGPVDLKSLPGIDVDYDAGQQRLSLDVSPDLLPVNRIAATGPEAVATSVDPGLLLNYDLFAQTAAGRTSISLWSEQRLFGPLGILANTGVVRTGGYGRDGYVRFDTSYRYIDEARALVATAGDSISGALPWTTSVRFGGLQLSRSFRTRPDLITVPLPDFGGQAALPSSVDLFVNGYRQQHGEVAPGRFVLDQVPVVNGAGEARVVTTDAVGRQIATVIPFYVAPELLRPGLSDFSLELGALRRRYGLRSLSYGRAVASAALRLGLTPHLTVEGHGEGARGLALAGLGAVWAPGLWGAMHGSAALSRRDGQSGVQWTVGYTYSSRSFSIGAEHRQRSTDFADLGSFDLGQWQGGTRNDRISASMVLGGRGSLGVAYIDARTRDGARARIGSASLSWSLGQRLSAFAAVDYDPGQKRMSAQLRFVMAIGAANVSAGVSQQPGRGLLAEADYARSVPTEGGVGYGASGAFGERGDFYGQANASWRGQRFEVTGGAAHAAGVTSGWAGVSGSVALLGGKAYLANQLPSAFAVIDTGMKGISVYYENQLIGETGKDGRLFVPRVTAYHPSRFAIDAIDLPDGAVAKLIEARVAVRENSGAVIAMPVALTTSVTLVLLDAQGAPLPPGTPVVLAGGSGGSASIVGWDGIVLIQGVTGAIDLTASTVGGGSCAAHAVIPVGAAAMRSVGHASCL